MARLVYVIQTQSSYSNLHHYFDLEGCLSSIDTSKLCYRAEQAGFIVVMAGRSHFLCSIPLSAFGLKRPMVTKTSTSPTIANGLANTIFKYDSGETKHVTKAPGPLSRALMCA